jgi:polyphenol oxidase
MRASPVAAALAAENLDWIVPEWPAHGRVRALSTTRNGAGGRALHFAVSNIHADGTRALLSRVLPQEPVWLKQVHGAAIADLDASRTVAAADGSMTGTPGTVCAVVTADCLPILFADRDATVVAAAHAGWRGLASGVIEASIDAMGVDPGRTLAWLGPAIGPRAFEVGSDVLSAFCDTDPGAIECFVAHPRTPMKWHADLYALARRRLSRAGVHAIYGGGRCTFSESTFFHSYRREGPGGNGRMATMIWLAPQ